MSENSVRAYKREWASSRYKSDPDFRKKHNDACKKWRGLNPDKVKAQSKKWQMENPSRAAELYKNWQEIPQKRISVLIRIRVRDAKKNAIPFDMSALGQLMDPPSTHCALCKLSLDYTFGTGKRAAGPSIDRVVPSKGYVAGNLAILCNSCNVMKGSATAEQHRQIADFIDGYKAAAN